MMREPGSAGMIRLRGCLSEFQALWAEGATACRPGQDTGWKDELRIDLRSLSFFVK